MTNHPLDSLDDDIRDHIERETQNNIERGMAPEAARYAALRTFGNVTRTKERSRAVWVPVWIDDFAGDVRYALRTLRRSPGFALVAIVTLALGIGANTAVFSVADVVLFRPLPYADPSRLANIVGVWDSRPGMFFWPVDPKKLALYREQTAIFEGMEGYSPSSATMRGADEAVRVARITDGLLRVLGVAPVIGRGFDAADMNADNVALIGHALWVGGFASRPTVLGETITLNDRPYKVVGVMPETFRFPSSTTSVWLPTSSSQPGAEIVARIRANLTIDTAQRELDRLAASLQQDQPLPNGWKIKLWALNERRARPVIRSALTALVGGVAFVMLIACANVANLLLVRATAREREMAVRSALGASRGRMVRQVLVECLVLAAGAGVAVVMAGRWGIEALGGALPLGLRLAPYDTHLDGRVIGFTAMTTCVTGVLCAALPALRAARPRLIDMLAAGKGSGGVTKTHRRVHGSLVVLEVALTFVLLMGAGLLANSFVRMVSVDIGFNPRNLAEVRVVLPPRYRAKPAQDEFFDTLATRLQQIPGVRAVTAGTSLPPTLPTVYGLEVEGARWESEDERPRVQIVSCARDYLETLGIPVLEGRGFRKTDTASAQPVIVVDRPTAQRLWPDTRALGRRVRYAPNLPWMTVIGIVGHVKGATFRDDSVGRFQAYIPLTQQTNAPPMRMVGIRTDRNPTTFFQTIRGLVHAAEPAAVVTPTTAEAEYDAVLSEPRFFVSLMTVFASVALSLAAIGLYGVLSFSVARRTHEIGVRMALGAGRSAVTGLVVREALVPAVLGLAAGVGAALWLTRFLQSQLYDVSPRDPATTVGVALLLVVTAAAAAYIPSRRATNVDPLSALRYE